MMFVLVVATASILGLTLAANAADVIGTNAVLDANGGDLYIPLKPSTSGNLGDSIPGPPAGDMVGLQSDSLTLYSDHATSSGFVSFVLSFDLSGELQPGEVMCCDTEALVLEFEDIDFKPYDIGWFNFRETLELTLLRDAGDVPGPVDLTIDDTNYGLYCGGFVETNNQTVTYTLGLKNDLGLTAADCQDINEDKEFGLLVTFRTQIEHLRANCCGDTIRNTPEALANSFSVCAIPEPATFLIALAGVLLAIMRKRKSA